MGDVLVTGAAGNVGTMIRPMLLERYGKLILTDIREPETLAEGEEFRQADLSDLDATRKVMQGVDRVIHLAGHVPDADWDTILTTSFLTTRNVFEAGRELGCERVVFASSVHAIGFYPRDRRLKTDDRVRPDGHYGLAKVFGEGIASLYADKFGMRCLSVRIGNCCPEPFDKRLLSIWIHPEDFAQLCVIGLEHPELHCEVVWGASGNSRSWWDNAPAFALGYRPRHDAESWAETALQKDSSGSEVADTFQGGVFCSDGFTGDLDRTRWK